MNSSSNLEPHSIARNAARSTSSERRAGRGASAAATSAIALTIFTDSTPSEKNAEDTGTVHCWNCGFVICAKPGLIGGMKTNSVVQVDPEIMSGTPCFAGTRVPARTLIDYLEGGDSLEDFLEDFPTVSRTQAVALLEEASELLALAPV